MFIIFFWTLPRDKSCDKDLWTFHWYMYNFDSWFLHYCTLSTSPLGMLAFICSHSGAVRIDALLLQVLPHKYPLTEGCTGATLNSCRVQEHNYAH